MAVKEVTLTLMRHVAPRVPRGYMYGGMEEVPLNLTGSKTLAALDTIARVLPPSMRVVSSPSPRAVASWREVQTRMHRFGRTPPDRCVVDGRFLEQSFGRWQGLQRADLGAHPSFQRFARDLDGASPPGGESGQQFLARVAAGLNDLVRRYGQAGGYIFLSCHGGVIRAALANALGSRFSDQMSVKIRRLSLTQLTFDAARNQTWQVRGVNITQ